MFEEDYNELSEAENKPQRQYVSSIPHPDTNKLLRENERLKKSLEKEQFFNKLLDQELKDLKNANGDYTPYDPNAFVQQRGVSKGAFYTVLLIALGLAGYIAYNWNNHRITSIIDSSNGISAAGASAAVKDSVPNIIANDNGADNTVNSVPPVVNKNIQEDKPAAKAAEDKVPVENKSVVTKQKAVVTDPVVKQPAKDVAAEDNAGNTNTADNSSAANNTVNAATNAAQNPVPAANQPADATSTTGTAGVPDAAVAAAPENRPVIGYYLVTSKANFYTRPDENTMRSAFIAQYNKTKVAALEESNGFIYVVYTNDLGYTIKGWLSLKDLTKVQ